MAKYFYSTISKIWWKFAFHSGGEMSTQTLFWGIQTKNFFYNFLLDYHRREKNKKFLLNFRFSICLPLEFWSHGPLLIHGVGHTITQFGRIWIVFLGGQAFVGVHMSNSFVLIVVDPGLVAAHAVTSHKFDRPVGASCI